MVTYLDHNATTPLDERVLEAMLPYLREGFGNPSSVHRYGRAARAALDTAREQVAALVGVQPAQVVFTSGGTEANNLALKGACAGVGTLMVGATEHPSVLEPAAALGRQGWKVHRLPVDGFGQLTGEALSAVPEATLISVMAANNETGILQSLEPVAEAVRSAGVLFHTDAVQVLGKRRLEFAATGAHLMSLSAHKIHGPKGAGALVVERGLRLMPLLDGGGQERGVRGGTENLPAIVGFGAAAELAMAEQAHSSVAVLRDGFEQRLTGEFPEAVVFGRNAERLPNTSFVSLPGIDGETLLLELDRLGLAVSSGSACGSARREPSHVLTAMGVEPELARGAIRVSFGRDNDAADVERLIDGFRKVAGRYGAAAAWA